MVYRSHAVEMEITAGAVSVKLLLALFPFGHVSTPPVTVPCPTAMATVRVTPELPGAEEGVTVTTIDWEAYRVA